jgi:hypothetical protein
MTALHTTRWSPDTCDCVLEYEWDDSLPQNQIVISYKNTVSQCVNHQELNGNNKKDTYDSVNEENKRKNGTITELVSKMQSDFGETDPQTGAITLKKGINVSWTWSGTAPNRIMTLTVTGITLTTNKLNQAKAFLDTKFGVGKVILVNS